MLSANMLCMANFLTEKHTYTCMAAFKSNFKHSKFQVFKIITITVQFTASGPKTISDLVR